MARSDEGEDSIVPEGYVEPEISTPEDDDLDEDMAKTPDEIKHDVEEIDERRNLVRLDEDDGDELSSSPRQRRSRGHGRDRPNPKESDRPTSRRHPEPSVEDTDLDRSSESDVETKLREALEERHDNAFYVGVKRQGEIEVIDSDVDSSEDIIAEVFTQYIRYEYESNDSTYKETAYDNLSRLPVSPRLTPLDVFKIIKSYDVSPDDTVMDLIEEVEKGGSRRLDEL
ncbi:MAG: hypothetical protein SV253_00565 [Halobacteria archaeon]|nr:hypothetical protein [Halobacteria archaeon]